jgi:protein tyrosine phosphatase
MSQENAQVSEKLSIDAIVQIVNHVRKQPESSV